MTDEQLLAALQGHHDLLPSVARTAVELAARFRDQRDVARRMAAALEAELDAFQHEFKAAMRDFDAAMGQGLRVAE